MKNAPAIPARKSSFVTWLSMSIAFVIQVKPDHAHQTSARTSAERAKPAALVFESSRSRDLGDREDEDEVEEELEVARAALLLGLARAARDRCLRRDLLDAIH